LEHHTGSFGLVAHEGHNYLKGVFLDILHLRVLDQHQRMHFRKIFILESYFRLNGGNMTKEAYDKLNEEMPKIAKIVSQFPEGLQAKAFDTLVDAALGRDTKNSSGEQPLKKSNAATDKTQLAGVAAIVGDKGFQFTVRDLKAKNASDAIKRLAYVLIRSYMLLTGEEGTSRKNLITPHFRTWRLDGGNGRAFLAGDRGILRNGDLYSLDVHAKQDADKYISEIQDQNISGSWKAGSSSPKSKINQKRVKNSGTN